MSGNKPYDPMDAMRKAMAELESRFDQMSQAIFGTDQFAQGANRAAELTAQWQKNMAETMSRQLALFNMPSREDVTKMGEQLLAMNERLARIEQLLEAMAPEDAMPKPSGPPRTKKPGKAKSKTDKE